MFNDSVTVKQSSCLFSYYSTDINHCRPYSVANYRGSAMSADAIRCRNPYCREWWQVVIAEENDASHWRNNIME